MKIRFEERRDQLFFIWPILVEHRIRDSSSPFWDIGQAALSRTHFELIVILEGIVEATGECVHIPRIKY